MRAHKNAGGVFNYNQRAQQFVSSSRFNRSSHYEKREKSQQHVPQTPKQRIVIVHRLTWIRDNMQKIKQIYFKFTIFFFYSKKANCKLLYYLLTYFLNCGLE